MGFSLNHLSLGAALVAQSCPTLATPWTVARQAPLSMGLFRQKYWSGLPFPTPGDLSDPGIEPRSPALQAGSLLSEFSNHKTSENHCLTPAQNTADTNCHMLCKW